MKKQSKKVTDSKKLKALDFPEKSNFLKTRRQKIKTLVSVVHLVGVVIFTYKIAVLKKYFDQLLINMAKWLNKNLAAMMIAFGSVGWGVEDAKKL